jgi:hypothetical protein
VAQQLSLIRSPDAPILCEKSGLDDTYHQFSRRVLAEAHGVQASFVLHHVLSAGTPQVR